MKKLRNGRKFWSLNLITWCTFFNKTGGRVIFIELGRIGVIIVTTKDLLSIYSISNIMWDSFHKLFSYDSSKTGFEV